MSTTITIAQHSARPLTVNRLGYGTMRLPGPDVWGEPADRVEALQILRTAVGSGVNFLDTTDYYGEDVTNRLIREALYPYPPELVICKKVGATRRPDKSWVPYNRPEELRASIEKNLRTLGQEQIQVVHYRVMPNSPMPLAEALGAMFDMQREGKILHVGLSNVTPEELQEGLGLGAIATVENMYSYAQRTTHRTPHFESRGGEEVLDLCEQHGIPLIPYFSLLHALPKELDKVAEVARKYNATPAQINIAWLLHRSPWLLPIPGTSQLAHLRENLQAANIALSPDDMAYLG
ncbi:aldo/keto reductase [Solirubrum puertoriconensis]|uniref:Aldo/keto reductase n=1 Tax=Solirubrum puertoriconensis TaxID=1751427 RepID=A0A9X0L4Q8_SOLP1|nr:aldo/keto reductase [Solirubrum puertoriconensis]KUG07869.1 aldo/keto reductase [Solirubrum puertoriconensis]